MKINDLKKIIIENLVENDFLYEDDHIFWESFAEDMNILLSSLKKTRMFIMTEGLSDHECAIITTNIMDYVLKVRYEKEDKEWSLKGKSLSMITEEIGIWHRELAKEKIKENYSWKPSTLKAKTHGNISILELTSSHQLTEEGEVLDHCVGSYSPRVSRTETLSIWSLMKNGKKEATVEVSNNEIVQFLGFQNRVIHEKDLNSFMKEWEKENKMKKSGWLR